MKCKNRIRIRKEKKAEEETRKQERNIKGKNN